MSPQPVIARLVPGNPVIKPFGVAELLLSRLRRVWIPACRRE
ncbi:hypothetical protein [Candidatus Spongiihabitans sp.]